MSGKIAKLRRDELAKFNRAYDQLNKSIEKIVIHDALNLMRKHKNLDEFVVGMGTWFFIHTDGYIIETTCFHVDGTTSDLKGTKYISHSPLAKFIAEWDGDLKITGMAMRFKRDGNVIYNW